MGAADCQFVGADTSRWDYSGALDNVQAGLDVAGMLPIAGEGFDAANAVIYAARGDVASAALSAAAMIPGAGNGATAAKVAGKYGDEVGGAVEFVASQDILFSQKGISWATSSGIPLDDLAQNIAGGWKGDPLRVIEQGNSLVSLDNRRLAVSKLIGADVPIQRVSLSDPKIRRIWEQRDGPQTSINIRGTGMTVDVKGRVRER